MNRLLNDIKRSKSIPIFLAIVFGMLIGCVILFIVGTDPFSLLQSIIMKSFLNMRTFLLFLQQLGLYLLLGFAAFFSFKVGFFNLGAPGQMVFAGMCASLFALSTPNMPMVIHAVLTTLIAVASAIFFSIAAVLLKMFLGINDIVSTVLLNWIALKLLQLIYFNTTAFKETPTRIDAATPKVPSTSDWVVDGVNANGGVFTITIFVAVAVLLLTLFIMKFTKFGYKVNVIGKNERAAYISGMNTKKILLISVAISGALVGLMTMGTYFGKNTQMSEINNAFPPAIGFNGLIIFVMSGQSVIGILLASTFMSIVQGPASEHIIGVPAAMSQIFAATTIYSVALVRIWQNWWNIKGGLIDFQKNLIDQFRKIGNLLTRKTKGGNNGNI